jgi:hypothetical protein
MARTREDHPLTPVCLCATAAALLCPEHEQDGPELRGEAYETLAMMYLNAQQLYAAAHKDTERLSYIEGARVQISKSQVKVAFAYGVGQTLREGIDAAVARGDEDDAMP